MSTCEALEFVLRQTDADVAQAVRGLTQVQRLRLIHHLSTPPDNSQAARPAWARASQTERPATPAPPSARDRSQSRRGRMSVRFTGGETDSSAPAAPKAAPAASQTALASQDEVPQTGLIHVAPGTGVARWSDRQRQYFCIVACLACDRKPATTGTFPTSAGGAGSPASPGRRAGGTTCKTGSQTEPQHRPTDRQTNRQHCCRQRENKNCTCW